MYQVLDITITRLFSLFYILILIRCLLSFIPSIDWYKQPYYTIRQVTDAYLNIFKRFIPPVGMVDISPIVAIIALGFIQKFCLVILKIFFGGI